MAKRTTEEVKKALEKRGAEVSEEASYDELVAQLKKLEAADEPPKLSNKSSEEEVKTSGGKAAKSSDDYLRQYQYRKGAVTGSEVSNPGKGTKAEIMKKHLLSQPKVRMMIPKGQGESAKAIHSVNINGYRLDLPKNTYLDLPTDVANLIRESYEQTEIALATNEITDEKAAALS